MGIKNYVQCLQRTLPRKSHTRGFHIWMNLETQKETSIKKRKRYILTQNMWEEKRGEDESRLVSPAVHLSPGISETGGIKEKKEQQPLKKHVT